MPFDLKFSNRILVASAASLALAAPILAETMAEPEDEVAMVHLEAAQEAGYDFESVDPADPFPNFPFEDFAVPDGGDTLGSMIGELDQEAAEELFYRCVVVMAQPVRYGETFNLDNGTEVTPSAVNTFCTAVLEADPADFGLASADAMNTEDASGATDAANDEAMEEDTASADAASLPDGAQTYASVGCASCHGPNGGGGLGPELTDNSFVENPEDVIELLLDGRGSMPAFNTLSNEEIASLVRHLRTGFNDYSAETLPADVEAQR